MKDKIDETLKKIAAGTSKGNSPTSSSTKGRATASQGAARQAGDLPGDPNCPYCGGVGYLRLDVPVGHPDFGRVQVCTCRHQDISQQVRERLFALSHLDDLQHLTFENFLPRGHIGLGPAQADSIERAFNQANQFAQKLNGWLLLQGDYGCGKTHLAAAIANFAVGMGVPTLFITVPDLLDMLRFSYQNAETNFEQRFEEVRQAKLLVLDDFGTQNATPWAQEKLFQILNYRYINHLPLVVTTNLAMEEIEGRIRSRLEDPALVTRVFILAPDFRKPIDDAGHPDLSSLALHKDQTFPTFDDRRSEKMPPEHQQSLEKALQAALRYAEKPEGWLVFVGANWVGKTHLAAAIANTRAQWGSPPLFIFVPDLLDHLRATFNPSSTVKYDRRFDEVKTVSVLFLDGLGAQSMTPWVREKLYQLFDYRYNAKLSTVITMIGSVDDLYSAEPGLASRMLDRRLCTIYGITAPPYRGAPPKENRSRGKRPPAR